MQELMVQVQELILVLEFQALEMELILVLELELILVLEFQALEMELIPVLELELILVLEFQVLELELILILVSLSAAMIVRLLVAQVLRLWEELVDRRSNTE